MKRIAIIGGGISGLSAAFFLDQQQRAGAPLEYLLFEASPRLGGVLSTEHVEDCILEAGPDSFLTEKPWASDLCRELGLGDQLIGSNDAERKTYILVNGRLIPIPDGLMFMVPTKVVPTAFSPLFSLGTKVRMAREWFYPKRAARFATEDESVASLVERHYGEEVVARLADPLLSGVYGGVASELSVRAVLPRFAKMEQEYGSLGRGILATRKIGSHKTSNPRRSLFTSLSGGMQQMVSAIVARLSPSALRVNTAVQTLHQDEGWLVSTKDGTQRFDAIILATPAGNAGALLRKVHEELSTELTGIRYSSSVIVNLVYDKTVRSQLPPGFGFLVPHSEGKNVLAVTFVHNKFNGRVPENRALLRCFLGGTRNEGILESPDNQIIKLVREELQQTLAISAEPLLTRVYKWKNVMAQYSVGHLDRIKRIASLQRQLHGLTLAGNAYSGIGVPDCVRNAKEAAADALRKVGLDQPVSPLSSAGRA
ncbi:MAG TPA: protoporphyrinogen oxidase [Terriglobales bacterium]|nr:protoporphyrinogen oxidase [Terriglobales bacterium]